MECKAELISVGKDWQNGGYQVAFHIDRLTDEDLSGFLRLTVKPWREKRSLDANALFWHCVGKIAEYQDTSNWDIYLELLKRYGKFSFAIVKPEAVDAFCRMWREAEVFGEVEVNGEKGVQIQCYFGSSSYDTKEFSRLLDGTIYEMKQCGIETPSEENLRRSLELWEKKSGKE